MQKGFYFSPLKNNFKKTKRSFMKTKINIIGTECTILEQFETEEPLSAEEVLEVLVGEYTSGKYDEIFGCNPHFAVLTRKFTPAEIVQKITEWKRKQNKPIQATEDMIADVLDEKYGIGNWGRE